MESKKEKRDLYLDNLKEIDPKNIVYIDESGIESDVCKERGWGKKGENLFGKKRGKYGYRTNIVAGYIDKKIISPMVFKNSCNTQLFEAWVEKFLIKELKKGQVVVMDNATFHKSKKTNDLIESVGCKIIFLPPYSPDLNPIEKFWANMKRWIRSKISEFDE